MIDNQNGKYMPIIPIVSYDMSIIAELYYRYEKLSDGGFFSELRVAIKNSWGNVIKDISYDDFLEMEGHSKIKLINTKNQFVAW